MMIVCSIDDCEKQVDARGWCRMHYRRWQRHGSPLIAVMPHLPADQRFWKKVDKRSGAECWNWLGATVRGYGTFKKASAIQVYTHRFAYELLLGPIADGMQLDHLCRNTLCCNPQHLEVVSGAENSRRASRIGHGHPNAPTSCRRGHDWSAHPPLLAHRRDGRVTRQCSVCEAERAAS